MCQAKTNKLDFNQNIDQNFSLSVFVTFRAKILQNVGFSLSEQCE
jgi:hypothetical protein